MNKDSKLIELSCKEVLMGIVKESKSLDKKLSFFQKTLLFDKIKEMKYEKVIGLLFNKGVEVTSEQKREFESKTKRAAKYGAAATVGAYGIQKGIQYGRSGKAAKDLLTPAVVGKPGSRAYAKSIKYAKANKPSFKAIRGAAKELRKSGAIKKPAGWKAALGAVAGLYLYRKLSDPCVRKNLGNKQAQMACKMEAIKKVVSQIKSDIGKCSGAADPIKCKKKLSSELIKWQTKYQQYLVQMNQSKKNK